MAMIPAAAGDSTGDELATAVTALVGGEEAFRQHAGGHTTGPNWPTFLGYADRYFKERAK